MQAWITELGRLTGALFGKPGAVEVIAMAALAIPAYVFVFTKVADITGSQASNWRRTALMLIVALIVVVPAAVAAGLYVEPGVASTAVKRWVPLAGAVVALLLIPVTLSCFVQKISYVKSLLVYVLSVAAVIGVILLVKGASGAVGHGGKVFDKTKDRTDTINEVIPK